MAINDEILDDMITAACSAVPDLYRVDAMRAIEAALGVLHAREYKWSPSPWFDAQGWNFGYEKVEAAFEAARERV